MEGWKEEFVCAGRSLSTEMEREILPAKNSISKE